MRRACLLMALATLALIWFGPLLDRWGDSFAAHMLAHMGVVAIAAPLIAVAVGRSPALIRPHRARKMEAYLWLPVIASLIELVVVWSWHAPAARALVERSTFAMFIEQATFLGAGLLLWLACLPRADIGAARPAAGAFGLLLTSVHMTLLGALLALSPRPLYGAGEVTCFGLVLDGQQDQELGGVIMLLIGAAVYLAGGLALLGRVLTVDPRKAPG